MFPDGYVDYYLLLEGRVIKKDTFNEDNVGTEIENGLRNEIIVQCFCSILNYSYSRLLDKEAVYLKDDLTDKIIEFRDIYDTAEYCDEKLRFMSYDVIAELSPKNQLIREEFLDFK